MQAFQNGPYTGYMAFLMVGIILSLLYTWIRFGRDYILPILSITFFNIAISLYISHIFYLLDSLPLYIAKRYIFRPIGFVAEGFLFSYILMTGLWIVILAFKDVRFAEALALSSLIHIVSFCQFPYQIAGWLILMVLFLLRPFWGKIAGVIMVLGYLVLYNIRWKVMGNIKMIVLIGEVLVLVVIGWIIYRGELDEF